MARRFSKLDCKVVTLLQVEHHKAVAVVEAVLGVVEGAIIHRQ